MLRRWLRDWLLGTAAPAPVEPPSRGLKVSYRHLAAAAAQPAAGGDFADAYSPARPMRGVVPEGAAKLAMDDASGMLGGASDVYGFMESEGLGWFGYPRLAQMTQRAEYRRPVEILANEMTRKWLKIVSTDTEDETKGDRIKELTEELERQNIKALFREALRIDGFFGRVQVFIDTGNRNNRTELAKPLVDDRLKIAKGGLKGFKVIEPIWTYPNQYNATDPLAEDYYKPTSWFVMGKQVHASRFLTIVSRPVPDIIKPAYAFGGLSLTQIAKPYVDNWLRTRQSVSDLIHAFSIVNLATPLDSMLEESAADDLFKRIDLFNKTRDNRGTYVTDKDKEELSILAVPLSNLDKLQAQSQEQMASVTGIPLIVLLGISPSGLNATAEPELDTFRTWIKSQQEAVLDDPVRRVIRLLMLNIWGEIDETIRHEWEPLKEESPTDAANINKLEADTDCALVDRGILHPEEVRKRLAESPGSGYNNIDVDDVPEPPEPELPPGEGGGPPQAQDSWEESKHPRADNGQFGEGGGGNPAPAHDPAKVDHLPHPREKRQPASSWEEMQSKGAEAHAEFAGRLAAIAHKMGLRTDVSDPRDLRPHHTEGNHRFLHLAPNKSEARAKEKVESEYEGDWSKLKDMVRATIAVNDHDEIRDVIAAIEAAGLKLAAKPKDNFANPLSKEGYRDINTLVEMENGMLAELQINTKHMVLAKEQAHALYERQQTLQRKNGTPEPTDGWSDRDRREFFKLREKQQAIYAPAWGKSKPRD